MNISKSLNFRRLKFNCVKKMLNTMYQWAQIVLNDILSLKRKIAINFVVANFLLYHSRRRNENVLNYRKR